MPKHVKSKPPSTYIIMWQDIVAYIVFSFSHSKLNDLSCPVENPPAKSHCEPVAYLVVKSRHNYTLCRMHPTGPTGLGKLTHFNGRVLAKSHSPTPPQISLQILCPRLTCQERIQCLKISFECSCIQFYEKSTVCLNMSEHCSWMLIPLNHHKSPIKSH